jgi:hypothetical protein
MYGQWCQVLKADLPALGGLLKKLKAPVVAGALGG